MSRLPVPVRRRLVAAPALILASGAVTALAAACGSSSSSSSPSGPTITVMTRNMDEGTDFNYLVGPKAQAFSTAAPLTYGEVLLSNIPKRAEAIADEINTARPDLVSLQEAASWEGPSLTAPGTTVQLDALKSLQDRLTKDGAHYTAVATLDELGISASLGPGLSVKFQDRDVILGRTDRPSSELKFSNVQTGHFSHLLSFTIAPVGTVTVSRGWASVDATVGGTAVRFVATHLESFDFAIQMAQGEELVAGPARASMPVIIAGDLNSGPNSYTGTQHDQVLGTYSSLTSRSGAGFVDVWNSVHPGVPGYTNSFHTEDPFVDNTTPNQRIDLILVHGALTPTSVELVGTAKVGDLWPSDHAGPVATLRVGSG